MKQVNQYSNVQCDMQWIRRVKQEEMQFMSNTSEEDEIIERQRLLEQFQRKNANLVDRLKSNKFNVTKSLNPVNKSIFSNRNE